MALYTLSNKLITINGSYASDGNTRPTLNKTVFNSITSVVNSLLPTERAICIIRHSVRDLDKWGQTDPLNEEGITKALDIGNKIISIPQNNIYFGATNYKRTCQTCYYISQGHEDSLFTDWTDVPSISILDGKPSHIDTELNYIDGNTFTSVTNWNNVLSSAKQNGIDSIAQGVINNALVHTNKVGSKKLSILVTHDNYVVPFIAYVSGKKDETTYNIEIDYSDGLWVNYMSGGVIVVDTLTNKMKDCYPLKCLAEGKSKQ